MFLINSIDTYTDMQIKETETDLVKNLEYYLLKNQKYSQAPLPLQKYT